MHTERILGGKKNQKEKHQPTAERKLALLKMRDIASSALREALWKDNEARGITQFTRVLSAHLSALSRPGSRCFDGGLGENTAGACSYSLTWSPGPSLGICEKLLRPAPQ